MNCQNVCVARNKSVLLNDVTICALTGHVTAILGPSGAGKTTLLNFLLGKVPCQRGMRRQYGNVAYVMAKDSLFPFLSVMETLQMASRLRLADSLPSSQRASAVTRVVALMRLDSVLNLMVGDETGLHEHNSISRGERRRLSIALELLSCPDVLVLDEPTTGIDSRIAYELILLLKILARRGLAVLTTLHQPSDRILRNLDRLVLLRKGEVIYQGPVGYARSYFDKLNFHKPDHSSIADFMLEVASQHEQLHATYSLSPRELRTLRSLNSNILSQSFYDVGIEPYHTPMCAAASASFEGFPPRTPPCEHLASYYTNSDLALNVKKEILIQDQQELVPSTMHGLLFSPKTSAFADDKVSWWTQFMVCLIRGFWRRRRNWRITAVVYLAGTLQACLFGAVFYGVGTPYKNASTMNSTLQNFLTKNPIQYFIHGITNKQDPDRAALADYGRKLQAEPSVLDPLDPLLRNGVNEVTESSLVLDAIWNMPKLSSYVTEVLICYRTLFPKLKAPSSNTTLMVDGTKITTRDNMINWKAGEEFRGIQLGDGYPSLDRVLSAGSAGAQIIWGLEHLEIKWPSLEQHHADLVNVFLPGAFKAAPYLTPLFCCSGNPLPFNLIASRFSKKCAQMYPKMVFPTPPADWQWRQSYSISNKTSRAKDEPTVPFKTVKDLHGGTLTNRRLVSTTTTTSPPKSTVRYDFVQDPLAMMRQILSQVPLQNDIAKLTPKPNRRRLGERVGLSSTIDDVLSTFLNSHPSIRKIADNLAAIEHNLEFCSIKRENSRCSWLSSKLQNAKSFLITTVDVFGSVLNIQGVILFLLINTGFMTAELFIDTVRYRIPFNREVEGKYLKSSAYVLANMVTPIIFTSALLIFIDLPLHCNVMLLYATVWLFSVAAYSGCYFIASIIYRVDIGIIALCCIISLMLVVTGIFIPDPVLPTILQYIKFLSFYRYGYSLILTLIQTGEIEWLSALTLVLLSSLYRTLAVLGSKYLYKGLGKESC